MVQVLVLLAVVGTGAAQSDGAKSVQSIDLDGPWHFETEDRSISTTISVPSAWEAQGIGAETALMNNQYSGIGLYRKSVDLSQQPPNSTCWLWIGGAPGGVMRSATVSANGARVGRHVGYLKPLEMQIPCKNRKTLELTVAVDSRWNVTEDPLWGGGSMWNAPAECYNGTDTNVSSTAICVGGDGYSFGGYGGMIGHARLLFRQNAWIEDSMHVRSEPLSAGSVDWKSTIGIAVIGGLDSSGGVLRVRVCEDSAGPCSGTMEASAVVVQLGQRQSLTVAIPSAKLWAPSSNANCSLYVASVTLSTSDGRLLDSRSIRFGVKQMTMVGDRILLNGERLWLRGYGDDGQCECSQQLAGCVCLWCGCQQ